MVLAKFRLSVLIAVVACVGLSSAGGTNTNLRMYGYGPSGELLVARTVFRIRVAPQGESRITDAVMQVNGESVPATYSQSSGRLEFRPNKPLPAGEVDVTASIIVNRNARYSKSWEAVIRTDAVPDYLVPDQDANEMLKTVNELRLAHGLPAGELDTCLAHVAEMHSRYLNRNKRLGHTQSDAESEFVGTSLKDRLNRFGWNEPATEAVVANFGSPSVSVENAFAAPYHRIPFVAPGKIEIGPGAEPSALTILFGHSTDTATVLSPAENQSNVPNEWLNNESPSPTRFFEGAGSIHGYPIVVTEFGHREGLKLESFDLRAEGNSVPVFAVDADRDPALKAAFFLIPKRPLKPRTLYTASATWTTEAGSKSSRTWSFTTR